MIKRIVVSPLVRKSKRALALAAFGVLLGVVAVPQPSLAASVTAHPPHIGHIVHPDDGSGDSPVMP